MRTLPQHLKDLRIARGLSIRKAAEALKLHPSRLYSFEKGTTHGGKYTAKPSREILLRMANLYQFPAQTLFAMAGLQFKEPEPLKQDPDALAVQEIAEIYRRLTGDHKRVFLGIARAYRALANPSEAERQRECQEGTDITPSS